MVLGLQAGIEGAGQRPVQAGVGAVAGTVSQTLTGDPVFGVQIGVVGAQAKRVEQGDAAAQLQALQARFGDIVVLQADAARYVAGRQTDGFDQVVDIVAEQGGGDHPAVLIQLGAQLEGLVGFRLQLGVAANDAAPTHGRARLVLG